MFLKVGVFVRFGRGVGRFQAIFVDLDLLSMPADGGCV